MAEEVLNKSEIDRLLSALSDVSDSQMDVSGVKVTYSKSFSDTITEAEVLSYLGHIHLEYPHEEVKMLNIVDSGNGQVEIDFTLKPPKAERIKRRVFPKKSQIVQDSVTPPSYKESVIPMEFQF